MIAWMVSARMWKLVSETTEDRKVGAGWGGVSEAKDNLRDARGAMGFGRGARGTWGLPHDGF